MFGINTITWSEFLSFIAFCLGIWYILLLVFAGIKSKRKNRVFSFEEYQSGISPDESLHPIVISANDYPSEILPLSPTEDIALTVSLYEETDCDDGCIIDHFAEKNSPVLAKMLPQIHYQQ